MIAAEGWKFVAIGAGVAALGMIPTLKPWGWGAAALGGLLAAFSFYFFRDPERPLPRDAAKVYSPGDGRVISISREGPGDVWTLRIFLSPLDVHVQRYPCSGGVKMVQYVPGEFAMAMRPEARHNERSVVRIAVEGRKDEVAVEQIAGFLARRIVCRSRVGDTAVAGERYGLIHFGSQAALHLPTTARPLVQPGERVVAGVTAVAEWTE